MKIGFSLRRTRTGDEAIRIDRHRQPCRPRNGRKFRSIGQLASSVPSVKSMANPSRGGWVFISILLLASVAVAQTDEKEAPAWESTQWSRIEAVTGRMNLDGTLRLSFPLSTSVALKQLGIRFELEHRVETDATGRARSGWRVRGLQSSLAPEGRTQLRWQPLAGAPVKFERVKIGRRLADAGSARWLIRELDPVEFEIRSLDGWAWRYRQGVLVGAEHPALGRLRFASQGAWITRIEQTDTALGEPPLLQASYNDQGCLISWQVGTERPQQLSWSEDGHLTSWRRADGSEMRLRYHDNLVSEVMEPGKPPQHFTWSENPGYDRGDSRWAAPVHLASDGANNYSYELTSKGFVMNRTELSRGDVTTTVLNPRRRRVSQQTGGFNFLVLFRNGPGGSALERVEKDGETMEQYLYDEHDRLIGIRRHGEGERTLRYDEAGRLMALEEEPFR